MARQSSPQAVRRTAIWRRQSSEQYFGVAPLLVGRLNGLPQQAQKMTLIPSPVFYFRAAFWGAALAASYGGSRWPRRAASSLKGRWRLLFALPHIVKRVETEFKG